MKLALLVLSLGACVRDPVRPMSWSVEGDGPRGQAIAMVEAARRVYPSLPTGGVIHLVPFDAYRLCYGPKPPAEPRIITGCIMRDGIAVAWPPPFACSDLTCSALPHELAHAGGSDTEGSADAGALIIIQEYMRGLP
jgi:hypothetical protein